MNMKEAYRILIIGAGPSGLAAALTLKRQGIDDLCMIEKGVFPRYKCCAGYVTGRTGKLYERFGLTLADAHYSLIRDFNIFYRGGKRQNILNKFLYTNRHIDRVELDDKFYELAVQRGVDIIQGTRIAAHDAAAKRVRLSNGKTVSYEKLIFADGCSGFGSRYQRFDKRNIAMQLVLDLPRPEEIEIHFGLTKQGYGWVSSYGGVTNIGLTDVYRGGTDYRKAFADYLKAVGIEADLKNLKGAFTPIGVRKGVLEHDMYFVGDAVGACDPLTLSGLRYGLNSGIRCAEAIASGNDAQYLRYLDGLRLRFRFMYALLRVFYWKPIQFCVFHIGCRCFGGAIAAVFNHFFLNKK